MAPSCLQVVCKLTQSCVKVVPRLSPSCLLVVLRLPKRCLKVVPKLSLTKVTVTFDKLRLHGSTPALNFAALVTRGKHRADIDGRFFVKFGPWSKNLLRTTTQRMKIT